ncbi:MAG: carboxypeptidase-like regulatory domain-containing protein, partial [Candidatus Limnocylindrales bacterium]
MAVPARVAAVSPGTLSGTVTDTTGHPISGLEIVLGSFPPEANPNVAAYTNAQGAYTISAAAGDYDIFLYDATGTYIYGCFDSYRAGSFVALSGPVMCMAKTLTDGQADHVNFAVPRARHLSGKIS